MAGIAAGRVRRPLRKKGEDPKMDEQLVRLNRFIAQSGLCSRREADDLISTGQITVNGKVMDQMGYLVKLDTNGMRPDVLKKALDMKIVDYVAMDIKNSLKNYEKTVCAKVDLERIKMSAEMIMNSRIDYDFRTTVVPGIHTEKDFDDIALWIGGAKRYFLQRFRDMKTLDADLKNKIKGKKIDLEKIQKKLRKHFGEVGIRG